MQLRDIRFKSLENGGIKEDLVMDCESGESGKRAVQGKETIAKTFFDFFANSSCFFGKTVVFYQSRQQTIQFAAVAQLDRVFGYEPKGRGFESLQARVYK